MILAILDEAHMPILIGNDWQRYAVKHHHNDGQRDCYKLHYFVFSRCPCSLQQVDRVQMRTDYSSAKMLQLTWQLS